MLQVFQTPYVQQHVQRYTLDERRRVLAKTGDITQQVSSTMSRRQNQLQNMLRDAKSGNDLSGASEVRGFILAARCASARDLPPDRAVMMAYHMCAHKLRKHVSDPDNHSIEPPRKR